jgi:hypothetical protein
MDRKSFGILILLLTLFAAVIPTVSSIDNKGIQLPQKAQLSALPSLASSHSESAETVESPIDSYSAVLYGKDQTSGNLVAFIHCYYQGRNVMSCEFYEDGTALPENKNEGGRVSLTYHWSNFDAVLDLLRNEKPVFFAFIESTKVGYVATGTSTSSHGTETIGEGES